MRKWRKWRADREARIRAEIAVETAVIEHCLGLVNPEPEPESEPVTIAPGSWRSDPATLAALRAGGY